MQGTIGSINRTWQTISNGNGASSGVGAMGGSDPGESGAEEGAIEEEVKRKSAAAVVPDILLTAEARAEYSFRNTNGFVPDPQEQEWSRCLMNTWTDEEQRIFI